MKELEHLTVEDRAKVLGGLIMVGVWFVAFLVFIQVFVVQDRFHLSDHLKSGSSLFSVVPLILLLLYVSTVLPMACVGLTAIGILAKRSISFVLKGILLFLLVVGAGILLIALVLSLFALIFSNISIYIQAPLTILTFFVCGIIMASVIRTKRVDSYLKKMSG